MLHVPVMLDKVLENLPWNLNLMMDGTLWHGGHSKAILSNYPHVKIIWVDRDPQILQIAKENLKDFSSRVEFVQNSYKNLPEILQDRKVDAILLDLWVNMEHFKDPTRGFSIKYDGPLDMRFDPKNPITAEWILKNYSFDQLKEVFAKYWDFGWKLLDEIVKQIMLHKSKLKTTFDLKNALKSLLSEKKIAVVFQALRIETNKELEQLEKFLEVFPEYLTSGGRCLIITYHSWEDRLVKNRFKELHQMGKFKNLTKKVIFPTWDEIKKNRASSSAKLRVIEKL